MYWFNKYRSYLKSPQAYYYFWKNRFKQIPRASNRRD